MRMLRIAALFGMAFTTNWMIFAQNEGPAGSEKDARTEIAGMWRGHSVCEDKNSPCHDEVNVYRFTPVDGKANVFVVTASKIVDGKEVVMGSGSEWKYDEKTQTVVCEKPAIRLTIDGKKMEGALSLPDGKVYRRIYLAKES